MQFGFVGINHKSAGLDIRDKTAFTDSKKAEFLQKAQLIGVEQCLILSTCNRSEVYFFCGGEDEAYKMKELYVSFFPDVNVGQYVKSMSGTQAMAYLFRVASGLESMVIGEDQILGQLKQAMEFSAALGYSKKELNKVVRDAVTCAKKIKTQLKISEIPLSICYVGIKMLEEQCGIKGKTAMVIGSGGTSVLALKYLYEYGAGEVYVCSRTFSRAAELRKEFENIKAVGYEDRYDIMEKCDIVVSATSAPHLVVQKEKADKIRRVFFLDLAAPRDIDPRLSENEGVKLINLDTIKEIVDVNQKERDVLVKSGMEMIETAVEETEAWIIGSRMDPTIESLQQRCEEIVNDSYSYLSGRLELNMREREMLKKVLSASLHRLINEPIRELKQLETQEKQDEYRKVVEKLFGI